MTLRIILTVVEVVLLTAILGWFLARIARLLVAVSATCGKIAFGVRAVESQVSVIGPTTERLNSGLSEVAARLSRAADQAEQLARR
jgi:hypothetical protein